MNRSEVQTEFVVATETNISYRVRLITQKLFSWGRPHEYDLHMARTYLTHNASASFLSTSINLN
jgi:hypothetical protein